MNLSAQAPLHFLSSQDPQLTRWCCPDWGWVFPPQLNPSHRPTQQCVSGDSKCSQSDGMINYIRESSKQNTKTGISPSWATPESKRNESRSYYHTTFFHNHVWLELWQVTEKTNLHISFADYDFFLHYTVDNTIHIHWACSVNLLNF